MIREIISNIYLIKVPLPGNPLQALNSYLIKGAKRNLLVDTGFNWPECKKAQLKAMAELGVDWADVDFFITHMHGDHSGLVNELATNDSTVYCSKTDADLIRACMTTAYWKINDAFYIKNGYPQKDIPGRGADMTDWISGSDLKFTYVQDGDILKAGSYHLTCIATPGHSPGHMCLYEPNHKFLIAGDHILDTITSNITSWGAKDDFLGLYLSSLNKISELDIQLVLPGHRDILLNPSERIDNLKHHHGIRLAEIMDILRQNPMTAYEVASHMHWEVKCNGWEEFPSYQKWFATGEAMAHLEHLTVLHEIQKVQSGARIVFSCS